MAGMLTLWAVFSALQVGKGQYPRCSLAYLGLVGGQLGAMLGTGVFMAVKVHAMMPSKPIVHLHRPAPGKPKPGLGLLLHRS